MSSKEIVKDLLEKLPEESSLIEIAQEIEFAGVQQGLIDADKGRTLTADQLRACLRSWARSQ